MKYKDLRKLSRTDLLELLIEQKKENDLLRKKLAESERKVSSVETAATDRSLQVQSCGTMAEAALVLNDVFRSIDAAASQYLENIKRCSVEKQEAYDLITAEAREEADRIVAEANERADLIMDQAFSKARELLNDAKVSAARIVSGRSGHEEENDKSNVTRLYG